MRLYNGCPDSDLAALWKKDADARQSLQKEAIKLYGKETKAWITYFPSNGKYAASAWINDKYYPLGGFYNTIPECAVKAIRSMDEIK